MATRERLRAYQDRVLTRQPNEARRLRAGLHEVVIFDAGDPRQASGICAGYRFRATASRSTWAVAPNDA